MELALSLGDTPKPFTSPDPPVQLNLLPFTPVQRSQPSSYLQIPWLNQPCGPARSVDVNRFPATVTAADDGDDGGTSLSSPNSAVSPFQVDFSFRNGNAEYGGRNEGEAERASDDDENGSTRKKLRLSKEQSAFLEESFKEQTTLTPKQKLELAKQLNLRPRQVEVWFQNRRARTKLKQTEVDCEYLKRCCETLTEENRRLQKELQELRALKTSQPFYMQLPATTLTMCPSCERVATNSCAGTATTTNQIPVELSLGKPRILPFPNGQAQTQQAQTQVHNTAS
ncbi:homeobox-leucine zipper protein HOX11-like isoform X2 [Lotus japonicus]|uniref:homeobox-leucine zipper protein HOX11-like isoform X2 n=1 Tax=Lotus japonicus TaxID=34305 RepID=UPI002590E38B|nr:homeobox-leucine zipper protein HOX11-like isoform X2 [Lotus japonicus]